VTPDPRSITFIADARRRALTKAYRPAGGRVVKTPYPNTTELGADDAVVKGIDELAEELEKGAAIGCAAIRGVRGKYAPDDREAPVFRLLYPMEGRTTANQRWLPGESLAGVRIFTKQGETLPAVGDGVWAVTWLPQFEDHALHWAPIDVDRIECLKRSPAIGSRTLRRRLSTSWGTCPSRSGTRAVGGRSAARPLSRRMAPSHARSPAPYG
jgi:hypothetical protein